MVLLTTTRAVVRALETARSVAEDELLALERPSEPPLVDAQAGSPISHAQLIDLAKLLKRHADKLETGEGAQDAMPYRLDSLLRGCSIYTPPPPPKKEPTPEYKALMARLRQQEEARAYTRMLSPPSHLAASTHASPLAYLDHTDTFDISADDEVSYAEVHRQIILIINVLVSIIAVSVFIWVAARHWSAPKRLGLSLGGSLVIAIAEVVIYSGYVRKINEAKTKERKKPEIKKIVESWVIDGTSEKKSSSVPLSSNGTEANEQADDGIRFRKGKHR
ncbi:hypothetical protein P154DRAFT_418970 [Amniculicola lignicola CBS 123094]|uniref:Uncharacterized protein n=1 Tax=Amniculicola lignicola CBS 123094 TaxID=1392246 RepID=A0A6A5X4Y6_9PLEO|nr:hypothetical protein P154DRAFT_418970 [Amniculicola lignicola CBS 123094]